MAAWLPFRYPACSAAVLVRLLRAEIAFAAENGAMALRLIATAGMANSKSPAHANASAGGMFDQFLLGSGGVRTELQSFAMQHSEEGDQRSLARFPRDGCRPSPAISHNCGRRPT